MANQTSQPQNRMASRQMASRRPNRRLRAGAAAAAGCGFDFEGGCDAMGVSDLHSGRVYPMVLGFEDRPDPWPPHALQ